MIKSFSFLFIIACFTFFFSCASAGIDLPRSLSEESVPQSVTSIRKPATELAREKTAPPPLLLPKPHNARVEAAKMLREHAVRFSRFLKGCLTKDFLALKRRAQAKNRPAPEITPEKTKPIRREPAPPETRSTATDPPVRRVVNNQPEGPEAGGRESRDQARTIYARQGDDIEISFRENGWLLLEAPAEGAGLGYVNRTIEEGKTLFKFRGHKIGNYKLPFQYQDNARGVMKRETIEIKVVLQKEFDAVMGSRESEKNKGNDAKRRAYAAKLYELGNFREALREFLAADSGGDPALNHLIASLALREKDLKNAVAYWTRNLEEKGEWHDKAVLGLVRAHLALKDRAALAGLARALLAVKDLPIEEELGLLIRFLKDAPDEALLFDLLQEYLVRLPRGASLAEIYFLLGRLYESSAALRDFKKSRECYQRVVREFPESPYFAPARERIAFINRHYFRVQ